MYQKAKMWGFQVRSKQAAGDFLTAENSKFAFGLIEIEDSGFMAVLHASTETESGIAFVDTQDGQVRPVMKRKVMLLLPFFIF